MSAAWASSSPRQKELLAYYRSRGHFVVAGGQLRIAVPGAYEALADTVVAGEAEYIWKEFCGDFERGEPRRLYHETGIVSLGRLAGAALRSAQAATLHHR